VLQNDLVWGDIADLSEAPPALIDRIKHYFLTYKTGPNQTTEVSFQEIYGFEAAQQVIVASMDDYDETFSKLHS
jgi:inorganic pyrophosphatase